MSINNVFLMVIYFSNSKKNWEQKIDMSHQWTKQLKSGLNLGFIF